MRQLTILFLIGTFLNLNAQDFRDVNWGDSPGVVKSKENAAFLTAKSAEDELYYESMLNNKKVEIAYKFIDNKLVRAGYLFQEKYTDANMYYTDYLNLKSLLVKKYGNPDKYDQQWTSEVYKGDLDQMGNALKSGHVFIIECWEGENTEIVHALYNREGKIRHAIEYSSTKLADLEKKKKEDSVLDDL